MRQIIICQQIAFFSTYHNNCSATHRTVLRACQILAGSSDSRLPFFGPVIWCPPPCFYRSSCSHRRGRICKRPSTSRDRRRSAYKFIIQTDTLIKGWRVAKNYWWSGYFFVCFCCCCCCCCCCCYKLLILLYLQSFCQSETNIPAIKKLQLGLVAMPHQPVLLATMIKGTVVTFLWLLANLSSAFAQSGIYIISVLYR